MSGTCDTNNKNISMQIKRRASEPCSVRLKQQKQHPMGRCVCYSTYQYSRTSLHKDTLEFAVQMSKERNFK